jgi:hypothetical protein
VDSAYKTFCDPKFSWEGATVSVVRMPFQFDDCGLLEALSFNVDSPFLGSIVVARKMTENVHFAERHRRNQPTDAPGPAH